MAANSAQARMQRLITQAEDRGFQLIPQGYWDWNIQYLDTSFEWDKPVPFGTALKRAQELVASEQ